MIISQPDGPQRTRHEQWYWDLVAEECGEQKAADWQWEHDWLKRNTWVT